MVIGPPDVDQTFESAFELLAMVEAVGDEIGGLSTGPDQDPVLVVPEGGCPEPDRPLLLIDVRAKEIAYRRQQSSLIRRTPSAEQDLLAHPGIEVDSEPLQIAFDLLQHEASRKLTDHRERLLLWEIQKLLAILCLQGSRQVADVLPLVAPFRQGGFRAEALLVAGQDRASQHFDLCPRVIHIELPLDGESRSGQQIRHRISHRGTPTMSDVERPGGVGADKLDLSPLPCANPRPTVLLPRGEDPRNHLLPEGLGQEEVQVTGASHLYPVYELRVQVEVAPQQFCNVPGPAAGRPSQGEGDRCRQISEARLGGVFPDHFGPLDRRHFTCLSRSSQ